LKNVSRFCQFNKILRRRLPLVRKCMKLKKNLLIYNLFETSMTRIFLFFFAYKVVTPKKTTWSLCPHPSLILNDRAWGRRSKKKDDSYIISSLKTNLLLKSFLKVSYVVFVWTFLGVWGALVLVSWQAFISS
jgi:hypothetical protein